MALSSSVRILIITTAVVDAFLVEVKPEALKEYEEICSNVTKKPFFMNNVVAGRTWRAYYAWNLKLDEECADVTFKYANDMIIDRIWKDMSGYLQTQPEWSEAVFLMTIGKNREMLLFQHRNGIAGEFLAVPNIQSHEVLSTYKGKSTVPLYKIVMKLLHKGQYLLASDCSIGVTTLSTRKDRTPQKKDINKVAEGFKFGDGWPACTEEPDDFYSSTKIK